MWSVNSDHYERSDKIVYIPPLALDPYSTVAKGNAVQLFAVFGTILVLKV
jgi:hypothetical protein